MKKRSFTTPQLEIRKLPINKSKVVFNSTFLEIPDFYEDKPFKCKECGKNEVWTAKQQKRWYEEAKGDLETTAVLCRACRNSKKQQRDLQKNKMQIKHRSSSIVLGFNANI